MSPVDSRGESLLVMLQATPRKRRVCGLSCAGDASISSPEDEEMQSVPSLCRKSSIEDAARKVNDIDKSKTVNQTNVYLSTASIHRLTASVS